MSAQRMLVTGAAGFIGSNFVRHRLTRHPTDHIVGLDLLTYAGDPRNLDGVDVRLVEGDIGNLELVEQILAEEKIDVVVNFAAESHNSLAVLDPGRFFRTNVLGTQALLEAGRRRGVGRFHHVSTCEVYGDLPLDSDESFTEESPYRPRTPYNASKAAADHAVRAYFETFDLPITITNCCNNYGPWQFPEKVIPLFLTNALDDQELPLYASTQNRREWLHVDDHCRAIDLVLEQGRIGETYNVGSGVERSIEQIADLVLDLTGKSESLKVIVPDRPGHDRSYLLDSSKIRDELGWTPDVLFDDGLRGVVEWYAANRSWWEPLRERAPVAETNAWR
ncbi:MAG: dTDP-glucose 4,6-dehydratase [Gaiellaceae bacterium]